MGWNAATALGQHRPCTCPTPLPLLSLLFLSLIPGSRAHNRQGDTVHFHQTPPPLPCHWPHQPVSPYRSLSLYISLSLSLSWHTHTLSLFSNPNSPLRHRAAALPFCRSAVLPLCLSLLSLSWHALLSKELPQRRSGGQHPALRWHLGRARVPVPHLPLVHRHPTGLGLGSGQPDERAGARQGQPVCPWVLGIPR